MKTIKIIQAKRNFKPFLTEAKKYELLGENVCKYKIKNDLGKVTWQNKSDFWRDVVEVKYGFLDFIATVAPILIFPTPVIHYDKDLIEINVAIVLPFVGFGFTYKLKPRV